MHVHNQPTSRWCQEDQGASTPRPSNPVRVPSGTSGGDPWNRYHQVISAGHPGPRATAPPANRADARGVSGHHGMVAAPVPARLTNTALLVLVATALVTGTLAFGLGTAPGRIVVVTHAIAGTGLLVLSPSKGHIVRRGLARQRSSRGVSIALLVFLVVTLTSGFAHAAGMWRLMFGLTTMQIHVAAAIASGGLVVWHVIAHPQVPRPTDLSRRSAVRGGGVLAAAGAVWLATEGAFSSARTRGAARRFPGSHAIGTDEPARMPVTQWFNDAVPDGSLDAIVTVRDARGARRVPVADIDTVGDRVRATLDCTGGWYATQDWRGASLQRIVEARPEDRSLVVTSVTGYQRRLPIEALPALLLATRVGDAPLSRGHGAPLRLVAPGRRGFWWVKWLSLIHISEPTRRTPISYAVFCL